MGEKRSISLVKFYVNLKKTKNLIIQNVFLKRIASLLELNI